MQKTEPRTQRMLHRILSLAWPTMLEEALQTLVQYIDTIMVGMLGTAATAAVGSTTTVSWLINGTISAIGTGFLSYIAKACGAGNRKKASEAAAQALFMVLVVGIFFTALPLLLSRLIPRWMQVDESIRDTVSSYFFILYTPMLARTAMIIGGTVLRAAGDSKTPMRVGVCVNLVNVVLNFFMIYTTGQVTLAGISFPGLGLGVKGAAIASAISFAVGGLLMMLRLWHHPFVSPKGNAFLPKTEVLKPCLRVALPNMLQRFCTSFGYVAFASMINFLGDLSTAAHTIANTVESAFYIPGYGMQAAAATLAGNAVGAKDKDSLRTLGKLMLPLQIGLMTLSGGLLFLFAPNLVHLFSQDEQVIRLATTVLRMVALSEPFYGFSIIMEGMLLGMGKPLIPFLFNCSGMWGVRILGTYICTHLLGFGLISAWACMIGHNLLIFGLYLWWYLSGKWERFSGEKSQP